MKKGCVPRVHDGGVDARRPIAWSTRTEEADWIGPRLSPFGEGSASSVVPRGFAAYARILHPATSQSRSQDRLLRWSELAAWSGLPLRRDSQFHSVALPPEPREYPSPLGQGPRHGSLEAGDLDSLLEVLARHTAEDTACWFCIWEGFGWETAVMLTTPGDASGLLPDPVPEVVRSGPRVRLPGRDYLLYGGPPEAASALMEAKSQSPSLWWPEDHSWCVASEIDLSWTYVGGPTALVTELLASSAPESLPSAPEDPISRVEPWVQRWIDDGTREVMRSGSTTIVTPAGELEATLTRPGRLRTGSITTSTTRAGGSGSGHQPIRDRDESRLERTVASVIANDLIGLVGH